nr:helix-turn-helix domain-containing protein [Kibdelosporangium sp. MJ126-NF4]CEL18769.1 Excisionase [Kibdelosporangium sp. MJ126-NF4]CTQ96378.1 Excisionase [Kibdelosporangium sp. MJ126-NF4]
MTTTVRQETYLPENKDQLTEVNDFLQAHDQVRLSSVDSRYFLEADPDIRVELPPEVHRALQHVVGILQRGLAVTVTRQTKTLTTQQAADLLDISRPTLVKLLEEGKIPYERFGTHRRVFLRELVDYRKRLYEEREAALAELSTLGGDIDEDHEEMLQRLRRTRKKLNEERRQRRSP